MFWERLLEDMSPWMQQKAAGAADVKESLFNKEKGYEADFSKGVYVSVFAGDDGDKIREDLSGTSLTRSDIILK